MGNWSEKGVVVAPIEFDGDTICFTIKRILVEDMMQLSKYIVDNKLIFDNPLEACKLAQAVIPKYIISMTGLRKADGSEMTIAEFAGASAEVYFIALIGKLFSELIATGNVGGASKNLPPPSPD